MDVSTGDQLEILGRLVLAGFLGGLIGLERELRGYPAGIRTIALVALGACLFTDVSRLMDGYDRVAAQIVSGIGFLGVGVIFPEGYTVRGRDGDRHRTVCGRHIGSDFRVRSAGGTSADAAHRRLLAPYRR